MESFFQFLSSIDTNLVIYLTGAGIIVLFVKFGSDKSRSKSLPALFTIIGVLGTFVGITIGLADFNVNPGEIEESVARLLDGLKFAFVTSIFGIFSAVGIRVYNLFYAPADDSTDEAELVVKILQENNRLTEKIAKAISSDEEASLTTQMKLLRTDYSDKTKELVTEFRAFAEKQSENNMKALVEAIETVIGDFNAKINEQFGENFAKLNEAVGKLLDWQENYYKQIEYMVNTIETTQKGVESSKQVIQDISENYEDTYKITEDFQVVLETMKNENEVLIKNIEEFAKLADNASTAMPTIEKRLDDLTTNFSNMTLETIKSFENSHKSQIDETSKIFTTLKSDLSSSFDGVKNNLEGISDEIGKEVKLTVENTNREIKNQITEIYSTSFSQLENVQKKMSQDLNDSIMKIDSGLENMLTNSLNSMSSQLVSLTNRFTEDYQPLTENLRNVVRIAQNIQTEAQNQSINEDS
jgi:hypothetical protein